MREERCFIYLIGQKNGNARKIGISKNVEGRVKGLATAHPHPLRILCKHQVSSRTLARLIEIQLHQRFSDHRIRPDGEWFADVSVERFKKEIKRLLPSTSRYGHLARAEREYCEFRDRLFECIGGQIKALCDDSPHLNNQDELKTSVAELIDRFDGDWLVLEDLRAELTEVA